MEVITPIQTKNKTQNKILRINLDGNWKASDFVNLFDSLSLLYQLFSELSKIDYLEAQIHKKYPISQINRDIMNVNGSLYKKLNFEDTYKNDEIFVNKEKIRILFLRPYKTDKDDLEIKQISYASPGFSDVVGFGKIIENMMDLIKHYVPNKNQRLLNENLELDIIEKKINILKSIGYSEKEIKKFIDIRNNTISNLIQLKLLDKVTSYELKEIDE
ncbi:hypothetical protein [Flavobacterium sp.]|uniref:hypothetical protein n=1 Tax=Flavobacterium sp. TaxID=239 RepID=UPI0038FC93E9